MFFCCSLLCNVFCAAKCSEKFPTILTSTIFYCFVFINCNETNIVVSVQGEQFDLYLSK